MKKIFLMVFLAMFLFVGNAISAPGTYTVTPTYFKDGATIVKITYKGSVDDGSVPDVYLGGNIWKADLGKIYLYRVRAYPITGGVSPDAADVKVLNPRSTDLLGGEGVNLISATIEQSVEPYNTFTSKSEYPVISTPLTVRVENQGTSLADFAVEVEAVR